MRFETSFDVLERCPGGDWIRKSYDWEETLVWKGMTGSEHFLAGLQLVALGELTQWVGSEGVGSRLQEQRSRVSATRTRRLVLCLCELAVW